LGHGEGGHHTGTKTSHGDLGSNGGTIHGVLYNCTAP
jgi:hypothetical protein